MAKYRKKPVVIDAIQWNGENPGEIIDFCNGTAIWQMIYNRISIQTLERTMIADIGDYIIKGVKGEFYPCKPDIFEKTYEPVSD
ncbi:MAG: hypothetical protein J6S83_05370 [Lachnospiraceae bacterium]|nr:hypothetical protein [Lachnospiraceae bacterium]